MRPHLLDPRTVSYLELIGNGKSFSVPPAQRDYSWTEEQWGDLWNDILELLEKPEERHYMGALVVEARSDREVVVIDGQQRLATLGILTLAVIHRLETLAQRGLDAERNRARATALRGRFIGEKHPASLTEASRLSLNETDDGFYQDYLVQLRTPSNPRGMPRSHRLIHECFRYYEDRLAALVQRSDDGEALANLIAETASRQLLFILITVDEEMNAYAVFETLNARGVELTTTDLLKNYLFSLVRAPSDIQMLHRRWRWLVGVVTPERFPDFLRYHLLCEHSRIRRQRLFRMVRSRVRTLPDAMELMEHLENRAELFAAISDPGNEFWSEVPEARQRIRELVLFRARQMTPLLFAAWEHCSRADFVRVLKLVSVITFRYHVVSALNPSDLEAAYAVAAKAVSTSEANLPAQIFALLKPTYVENERMQQDFERLRVSTRGPRRKLARYILARLEADASGRSVDPDTDPFTIEHILPENADSRWEAEFAPDRQEAFVDRLGNLTLLASKTNRDIGRNDYSGKVAAYRASGYSLTRAVAEMAPEEWTPALLEHRQRKLAVRAVQLWRSDFD